MEGRCEDVVIIPSHFSSAVSLPREVDCLSQIWTLPGAYYGVALKLVRCYKRSD